MSRWSKCPHCRGATFEPEVRPKQWCGFCLPVRHETGLNIPARDMSADWHRDRNQKPGFVTEARAIEFALFVEDLENRRREAEEAL
jgi:hypothetical protein